MRASDRSVSDEVQVPRCEARRSRNAGRGAQCEASGQRFVRSVRRQETWQSVCYPLKRALAALARLADAHARTGRALGPLH